MNTIKFKKGNVQMIAHRGLSGLEKENSNAAFIAAGNRSYIGIETDIHRTCDGNFVIIHDDTTERVSGNKMIVEDNTLADLRNIVLYDIDGSKERLDIRIPTLEEYIGICKKYDKIAVLELKSNFSTQEIIQIVSTITKLEYLEKVIFISFHLDVLKRLREIYSKQPAQYLVGNYNDNLVEILLENNLDLDIHFSALNEEIIQKLHSHGIKVNCWTVDSPNDGERLAAWGVDYITSNILE